MQPDTTYGARAAPYRALPRTYGAQAPYLRSGRCTRGCGSVRSGPTRSRTRPPQTDAKSDAHHAPKRRPSLKRWASQHPTAPVRTASFRPRVTPQTQRGCAARCERTQPRRSSTKGRRRSASTTGCRRSGSRYRNGRRGIRTPCCFLRVSRPKAKAAQKAAHGAGGARGEAGANGGDGTGDGRACRGRGHTGQRGGFPGGWRGASGQASWAATGPP